MSMIEDPVATIVRLLRKNMRVVKDDGSLAYVHVSREWLNREFLKNYDGQVTVGLEESQEQILEISAKTRRRLNILKVNVWTADKPDQTTSGLAMREKLREEVHRVIRQNRNKPNVTVYDFYNTAQASDTHKAYYAKASTELTPQDNGWSELADDDYAKIWYSDDTRCSSVASGNGEYALMLFRFKMESEKQTIKQAVLAFEGYGVSPFGNGFTVKVWNSNVGVWQNSQTSDATIEDSTVTVSLDSDLTDYVDDDGFLWLLAETANPSDGSTDAALHCDYASCKVTANGVTYCDVVSYRDLDKVDVKPFIFGTEFTVKTWLFEKVEVT